ncbi:UNVERIFIED_CONTAM: WD domain, G-beta repeat-containing protein [Hammondia hammondi]|eukprot:XP_008883845.1 WD domain, G-beta repeat-containing protein [Hammondia hammondi]
MFVERLLHVHHGGLPITSLDFQPHAARWDMERLATAAANCVKIWVLHSHSPSLCRALLCGKTSEDAAPSQKRQKLQAAASGGTAAGKDSQAAGFEGEDRQPSAAASVGASPGEPPPLSRPPLTVATCVWTASEHRSEIMTLRWAPTGEFLATCDADGNLFVYALNLPLPTWQGTTERADSAKSAASSAAEKAAPRPGLPREDLTPRRGPAKKGKPEAAAAGPPTAPPCLCASLFPSSGPVPWQTNSQHSPPAASRGPAAGIYTEKWRQVSACLCSAVGHIFDMCWCHDSRTIALAGARGRVCLVDVPRHEVVTVLSLPEGDSGMVKGVAWDPQASLLAACTSAKKVFVWRTQRRTQTAKKQGPNAVWHCSLVYQHNELLLGGPSETPGPRRLSWHPQGTLLALPFAERNGRVFGCCLRVQDDSAPTAETGEAENAPGSLPEQSQLGATGRKKLAEKGEEVFSSSPPLRLRGHRRPIRIVRFAPDLLVEGSASKGSHGSKGGKAAGSSASPESFDSGLCCLYAQASVDGALSIWQFSQDRAAPPDVCGKKPSSSSTGEKTSDESVKSAGPYPRCLAVLINFLDENTTLQDLAWGRQGQWLAAACTGGGVTLVSLPHATLNLSFATNWLAYQLASAPTASEAAPSSRDASSVAPSPPASSLAASSAPACPSSSSVFQQKLQDPPSPGSRAALSSAACLPQTLPTCSCSCKCCCCSLHRYFAFVPAPPAAAPLACAGKKVGESGKAEAEEGKVGRIQTESVTAGGKRRICPVNLSSGARPGVTVMSVQPQAAPEHGKEASSGEAGRTSIVKKEEKQTHAETTSALVGSQPTASPSSPLARSPLPAAVGVEAAPARREGARGSLATSEDSSFLLMLQRQGEEVQRALQGSSGRKAGGSDFSSSQPAHDAEGRKLSLADVLLGDASGLSRVSLSASAAARVTAPGTGNSEKASSQTVPSSERQPLSQVPLPAPKVPVVSQMLSVAPALGSALSARGTASTLQAALRSGPAETSASLLRAAGLLAHLRAGRDPATSGDPAAGLPPAVPLSRLQQAQQLLAAHAGARADRLGAGRALEASVAVASLLARLEDSETPLQKREWQAASENFWRATRGGRDDDACRREREEGRGSAQGRTPASVHLVSLSNPQLGIVNEKTSQKYRAPHPYIQPASAGVADPVVISSGSEAEQEGTEGEGDKEATRTPGVRTRSESICGRAPPDLVHAEVPFSGVWGGATIPLFPQEKEMVLEAEREDARESYVGMRGQEVWGRFQYADAGSPDRMSVQVRPESATGNGGKGGLDEGEERSREGRLSNPLEPRVGALRAQFQELLLLTQPPEESRDVKAACSDEDGGETDWEEPVPSEVQTETVPIHGRTAPEVRWKFSFGESRRQTGHRLLFRMSPAKRRRPRFPEGHEAEATSCEPSEKRLIGVAFVSSQETRAQVRALYGAKNTQSQNEEDSETRDSWLGDRSVPAKRKPGDDQRAINLAQTELGVCLMASGSGNGGAPGLQGNGGSSSGKGDRSGRECGRGGDSRRGKGVGGAGGAGDGEDDDAELREKELRKSQFLSSLSNGISKPDSRGEGEKEEDGKKKNRRGPSSSSVPTSVSVAGEEARAPAGDISPGGPERGAAAGPGESWGSWNPFRRRLQLLRQFEEEDDEEEDEEDDGTPAFVPAATRATSGTVSGTNGNSGDSRTEAASLEATRGRREGDTACSTSPGEELEPQKQGVDGSRRARLRTRESEDRHRPRAAKSASLLASPPSVSQPERTGGSPPTRFTLSEEERDTPASDAKRRPEEGFTDGEERESERVGRRHFCRETVREKRRVAGEERRARRRSGEAVETRRRKRQRVVSTDEETESESSDRRSSGSLSSDPEASERERNLRNSANRRVRRPRTYLTYKERRRERRASRKEARWTSDAGDSRDSYRRRREEIRTLTASEQREKGVPQEPLVGLPLLKKKLCISTTLNGTPVDVVAVNSLETRESAFHLPSLSPLSCSPMRGRDAELRGSEARHMNVPREVEDGEEGPLLCCFVQRKLSHQGEEPDQTEESCEEATNEEILWTRRLPAGLVVTHLLPSPASRGQGESSFPAEISSQSAADPLLLSLPSRAVLVVAQAKAALSGLCLKASVFSHSFSFSSSASFRPSFASSPESSPRRSGDIAIYGGSTSRRRDCRKGKFSRVSVETARTRKPFAFTSTLLLIDMKTGAMCTVSGTGLSESLKDPISVCRWVALKRPPPLMQRPQAPVSLPGGLVEKGPAGKPKGGVLVNRNAHADEPRGSAEAQREPLNPAARLGPMFFSAGKDKGARLCIFLLTAYAEVYLLQPCEDEDHREIFSPGPLCSVSTQLGGAAFLLGGPEPNVEGLFRPSQSLLWNEGKLFGSRGRMAAACSSDKDAAWQCVEGRRDAGEQERGRTRLSLLSGFSPGSSGFSLHTSKPFSRGEGSLCLPLSSASLGGEQARFSLCYFADLSALCRGENVRVESVQEQTDREVLAGGGSPDAESLNPFAPRVTQCSRGTTAMAAPAGERKRRCADFAKILWIEIQQRSASLVSLLGDGEAAHGVPAPASQTTRSQETKAVAEDDAMVQRHAQERGDKGDSRPSDRDKEERDVREAICEYVNEAFGAERNQSWIQLAVGLDSGKIFVSLPPCGVVPPGVSPVSPHARRWQDASGTGPIRGPLDGDTFWVREAATENRGHRAERAPETAVLSLQEEPLSWGIVTVSSPSEDHMQQRFVRIDELAFQHSDFFSLLSWRGPGETRETERDRNSEAVRGAHGAVEEIAPSRGETAGDQESDDEAWGGDCPLACLQKRSSFGPALSPVLAQGVPLSSLALLQTPWVSSASSCSASSGVEGDAETAKERKARQEGAEALRKKTKKEIDSQRGKLFRFLFHGRFLGPQFAALLGATPQGLTAMRRVAVQELLERNAEGRQTEEQIEEERKPTTGEDTTGFEDRGGAEGEDGGKCANAERGGSSGELSGPGEEAEESQEEKDSDGENGQTGQGWQEAAKAGEQFPERHMPSQRRTLKHLHHQVWSALAVSSSSEFLYWLSALLRRQWELRLFRQFVSSSLFLLSGHLAFLRRLLWALKAKEAALAHDVRRVERTLRLRGKPVASSVSSSFFAGGTEEDALILSDELSSEKREADAYAEPVDWRLLAALRLSAEETAARVLRVLEALESEEAKKGSEREETEASEDCGQTGTHETPTSARAASTTEHCGRTGRRLNGERKETDLQEEEQSKNEEEKERHGSRSASGCLEVLSVARERVRAALEAVQSTREEVRRTSLSLSLYEDERRALLFLLGESVGETIRAERQRKKRGGLFAFLPHSGSSDDLEREEVRARREEAEAVLEDIF